MKINKKPRQGFISVLALLAAAAMSIGSVVVYRHYSSKPEPTKDSSPSWQEYVNPQYGYKIKYPPDWFFHQTGYHPPPPATIKLSNIDEKMGLVGNSIVVEISSLPDPDQNLDTNAEIQSLESQGFTKKSTTISGQPALVLEKENTEGGIDTSIYVYYGGNVYRLSWGLWNSEIKRLYQETIRQIIDSFKF